MIIRKATVADAEGIAIVHVDCWKSTYKEIISENHLNNLSYEKRTALWVKNISSVDNSVFVAVNDDERIIGFTCGSMVKPGEYPDYDGDVTAIYILEAFQGLGIGKKLLVELFAEFNKLNFRSAIVKVLEKNNACQFYEAMGAEIIDSTRVKIGEDSLKLLVYGWKEIGYLNL